MAFQKWHSAKGYFTKTDKDRQRQNNCFYPADLILLLHLKNESVQAVGECCQSSRLEIGQQDLPVVCLKTFQHIKLFRCIRIVFSNKKVWTKLNICKSLLTLWEQMMHKWLILSYFVTTKPRIKSLWILCSMLVHESETAMWLHQNLVNEVTHKPQLETTIAKG